MTMASMAKKIIRREEICHDPSGKLSLHSGEIAPVEPDFNSENLKNTSDELIVEAVSAEEIENIKQEAYLMGFEKGEKGGLRSGEEQIKNRLKDLQHLIENFSNELNLFNQKISDQVLKLIIQIVELVLKDQIKLNPQHILTLVDEALDLMPDAHVSFSLYLSPEDFVELEPFLIQMSEIRSQKSAWHFKSNPHLSRGSFELKTEQARVEFNLEERWQKIRSDMQGPSNGVA